MTFTQTILPGFEGDPQQFSNGTRKPAWVFLGTLPPATLPTASIILSAGGGDPIGGGGFGQGARQAREYLGWNLDGCRGGVSPRITLRVTGGGSSCIIGACFKMNSLETILTHNAVLQPLEYAFDLTTKPGTDLPLEWEDLFDLQMGPYGIIQGADGGLNVKRCYATLQRTLPEATGVLRLRNPR